MPEETIKPTAGKIIKRIFKFTAYSIILFVYCTIIVRSFISCDVKLTKEILINDTFRSAYASDKDSFRVLQYGMQNAFVPISDTRIISFDKLYYIPAAKQLQVTVKYNTDIAPYKGEGDLPFRFFLKDKEGNQYKEYFLKSQKRFQYGYIRLCFEGILLTEDGKIPGVDETDTTKTYTLYIERAEKDGSFRAFTNYAIYAGSKLAKNIEFKVK